ncbi:GAF and ANTAR domain-containing protein [Cellulomonas xylanilytica]|uniref:Transcriptional regulator n=1 Tax=Cellulomonas xylanilytica TaxID=233583 RepID=A0A510V997_9CELL|nr:GAF and ANTAR domain-containing protein [Cellulomonas xylanilytica]GEK23437.1 transcriptional regulator [Cellulomonas xylanilytica]
MTLPAAPDELRQVVTRTSAGMITDQTVETLLRLLTSAAARIVVSAAGAGLTTVSTGSGFASVASTDPLVEELDALQYELGEGPCVTAWRDRDVIRVDDVATERRWPRWAAAAAGTPVVSSLSAPLVFGNSALGAVKVYAEHPGRFGAQEEATLRLFGAHAAILLAHAESYRRAAAVGESLPLLLQQRDDLNRACGVIMQREGVSAETAMTVLISIAERDGRSVHDAATTLLRRSATRS